MNKKKGFTLVEILAVVIILGIISIIVYPVLNKTLKDNRKRAFEASLNAVVRAAELYKTDNNNTLGVIDYDDGIIDMSNLGRWEAGTITDRVDSDGLIKVYLAGFYDGEFCAKGFENNFTITEGKCVDTPDLCFMLENNTITEYGFNYSVCPTDINIPTSILGEDVLYISDSAFESSNVSSVIIPNSILEIGDYAFYDTALTSLDLTNATSLEYIGESAFEYTYLDGVDFSNLTNLVQISEDAFDEANIMGEVDFSNSLKLTSIGYDAFCDNQISSVKLSNLPLLQYIDDSAFEYNNLTGNLDLSNLASLEYIGESSFYNNNISSVNFNNIPNLEEIGDYAFEDNSITGTLNLKNLPNLLYIDEEVFRNNSILSVDFTGTNLLQSLDFCAFCNNDIETLTFDATNNIQYFGGWAFADNRLQNLDLSLFTKLSYIGDCAFNNNLLPDSQAFIYHLDGTVNTSILRSYGGAKRDNVVIPSNIVEIGTEALGYLDITSVDFSQATNLQHIDRNGLWKNNLTTIALPNSLIDIGEDAFSYNQLDSIIIPANTTTIGINAFANNNTWQTITIQSVGSHSKYRFNGNWVEIGWPIEKMPVNEVVVSLSTTNPNNFVYSDFAVYKVTVPTAGTYKLEVWGAEGGGSRLSANTNSGTGGKGGYSAGQITLPAGTTLYVYVGGNGLSSINGVAFGGYNGGGSGYASSSSEPGNGGGGATDIRIGGNSIYRRVIVAGGGGGGGEDAGDAFGYGGGTTGVGYTGYDGTQVAAGTGGSIGQGGTTNMGDGGGGGGGWYGGGTYSSSAVGTDTQGGGGGSGWIYTASTFTTWQSGNATDAAKWLLDSSSYLTNVQTIAGNATITEPDGSSVTGHAGSGYARITFVS